MTEEELNISDKEFIKRYVPFSTLKKAGFFPKDLKRSEHEAILKRFLGHFGWTKREYILSQPTISLELHPNVITGKMPSTVDANGNLHNNGFKLSL